MPRPKGAKNKRTLELARAARQYGMSPLEMLLQHANECWESGDKDKACYYAEKAAPYCHARKASITDDGGVETKTIEMLVAKMKEVTHAQRETQENGSAITTIEPAEATRYTFIDG